MEENRVSWLIRLWEFILKERFEWLSLNARTVLAHTYYTVISFSLPKSHLNFEKFALNVLSI